MTRRVKNSLAAEWGPWGEYGLDLRPQQLLSPTGRTTSSIDLKPKTLTYEMLLETKRQFEEMEIGNLPAFPDYSQIERRILDSMGIPFSERPNNMYFWRDTDYEPPSLWADQASWPNPCRTHKYEEHRQKVKAMQEAQAAERIRKSYEELFV